MSLAVLFPGQGSQVAGMGDPWAEDAAARDVLDRASSALGRDVIEACRDEDLLSTTEWAQPLLLACDVAAFAALTSRGVRAEAAAGHSLGEYAALVAADVLALDAALALVAERGRAMQTAADERPGTMSALLCGTDEGARICEEARGDGVLAVANENGPKQVVLSGSVDAIERAESLARDRRVRAIRLNVAGAFHSPLMASAVSRMRTALAGVELRPPTFPVVANVSAEPVRDPEMFRDLLARHVVSPVRWEASIRALDASGVDRFVEAGPGDVLTKLARRIVPQTQADSAGSPGAASDLADGIRGG